MANFQVLYAEDEYTNRKLLEIQLGKAGITCDLATDGNQVLDKIHDNKYEIIILDQYMPGLNGDELAKHIHQEYPELPLFAITSDDSETENLRAAGFLEVFVKPLRGNDYIELLRKYLKS